MRLASSQPLSGRSEPAGHRFEAIEERRRQQDPREQRADRGIVVQAAHGPRLLIERAQTRFLGRRQRPAPRAAGKRERIGNVTRLRERLRPHHLVVVGAQRCDMRPRRRGQRRDLDGVQVLDPTALQLQRVVIGQHAQIRVVVRPRSEQVVPRLVQPRAIGAVHDVLGEEPVVALVLHLHHERVVLGTVVGVVEWRRHRILVGGIGLAVRVGRQQRHVFGDVRAERPVACARRIAEDHALARRRAASPPGDRRSSRAPRRSGRCRSRRPPESP